MKLKTTIMLLSEFYKKTITIDNLWYFLQACTDELNFHPDTPFEDYIVYKTEEQCFSDKQCEQLNSRMEEAFALCNNKGLNLYEIAFEFTKN